MAEVFGILFCAFITTAGCVLLYGTFARWPVLVNPPRESRFFYSQAAVRWFFGPRTVVLWTYILGFLFISVGLFGLWNGSTR